MSHEKGTRLPGVMHVVWSLGIAGAEMLAYNMAINLPASGFRPVICCIEMDGPLRERFSEAGIPLFFRRPKSILDWGLVMWLREIMLSEGISVVHAHQYNPLFYSCLSVMALPGVKLVFTEHGRLYPERPSWKRKLINPLLGTRIDHLVSISCSTREAMIRYDRFPGGRIRVIHNGVDLRKVQGVAKVADKRSELEIPEGFAVLGTAARFDRIKNLPMMLRAFREVVKVRPQTLLLLAGTGSLESALRELASELELENQVRFVGLRHDLPDLMRVFDVFLLSSFTEGVSVTLLEAMANGVPAVVTAVGGNPEVVVDGETGYLVPLGEEGKMAARVLELLGNPVLAKAMGTKAMKRVDESFSFGQMMASYLDLYRGDGKGRSLCFGRNGRM